MSLVAYWSLDGDYVDRSGNGLTGTPINSPTFVAAQRGQGVQLNGTSQRFGFTEIALTGEFTFACWFKRVVTTGVRSYTGRTTDTVVTGSKIILFGTDQGANSNKFAARLVDDAGLIVVDAGYGVGLDAQMNFMVCARDTSNNVYFSLNNGALITGTPQLSGTYKFDRVGNNIDNQFWGGILDEIRVYDKFLSVADLTQIYLNGLYDITNSKVNTFLLRRKIEGVHNRVKTRVKIVG